MPSGLGQRPQGEATTLGHRGMGRGACRWPINIDFQAASHAKPATLDKSHAKGLETLRAAWKPLWKELVQLAHKTPDRWFDKDLRILDLRISLTQHLGAQACAKLPTPEKRKTVYTDAVRFTFSPGRPPIAFLDHCPGRPRPPTGHSPVSRHLRHRNPRPSSAGLPRSMSLSPDATTLEHSSSIYLPNKSMWSA
jgi:hypothetical protein